MNRKKLYSAGGISRMEKKSIRKRGCLGGQGKPWGGEECKTKKRSKARDGEGKMNRMGLEEKATKRKIPST